MLDNDNEEIEFDSDEADLNQDEYLELIIGEITNNSIETLELLCKTFDRNESLGIIIEALSKSLGNMISLVKDDEQQDVIDTANDIIHQGLVDQQEAIAEMAYGCIGHA